MKRRYKCILRRSSDEKIKVKKEIENLLPDESGISVDEDKGGIVLRLGEILFDFDSYKLKQNSFANLDSRSGTYYWKNIRDREIVVEGHTDDVGKAIIIRNFLKKGKFSSAIP